MSPEFYRTELFLSHFNFGTTSLEFLILIFMFPTSFCYSLVCGNEKSFENYQFLNALFVALFELSFLVETLFCDSHPGGGF